MKDMVDLIDLGLTERVKREASMYNNGFELARITAQHKDLYKVMNQYGEMVARVSGKLRHRAAAPADYPVVGDWVLVERMDAKQEYAVICLILTRKSLLERKAAGTGHQRQAVAANIDTLFICMSLGNDYNLRRIERYLSIAWESMATPVVVLTKSDLCDGLDARVAEICSVTPGVDVVVSSVLTEGGIEGVRKHLQKGKTAAFVGSSGVGKSTMINRLIGTDIQTTKDVREDDGKGRHATTHRQLFVLPGGGVVIDTPGMREIQIACADMANAFPDIEELARGCRFRDCKHELEPDCAVKRAVEEGRISPGRLDNYRKLQKELAYFERRETMTAAQAEKLKITDMMGSLDAVKQLKKNMRKRTD